MGSVIQMFASITGGLQNAAVQQDLPMNTTLIGLVWTVNVDLDADAETFQAQLAFGPVFTGVTDARSVVDVVGLQAYLLTSGYGLPSINVYRPLPDLAIMGGERLFINISSTAGVTGGLYCMLHLQEDLNRPSRRRF